MQVPQLNNVTARLLPQTWKWTCAIFQHALQPLTLTIF